ncbi:MAG TPA: HTTM domain-containing protein, partial [Polyangiaceae bacterium]|nr:HTTM domain-containing protein [Polyangiaceae bacterium]
MIARLRHLFLEERDTTLLGLLRVAMGVLLLANGGRLVLELQQGGYFGDNFHVPMLSEAWVPSRLVYIALLSLKIAAAVAVIVGIFPRGALLLAALLGLYLLSCDRLGYHNNRYATHLLALLLAFTPCDRSFSLPRRLLRRPRPAPLGPYWAVRLLQLQISLMYLVSGGGKLLDPDWRGGRVMLVRFERGLEQALAHGQYVPNLVIELWRSPQFANIVSKFGITTEFFLAIGLWLPRTRALALWVGLIFHLGIQLSA